MATRRKGRECALQIMYKIEVLAKPKNTSQQNLQESFKAISKSLVNEAIEDIFAHFAAPADVFEQASALVRGALNNIEQINEAIQKHSLKWRLERLSKIDRNVLQLASYELFFSPDLSTSIILDEAIEIARKFGSEKSASFVNGILDAISRDARKDNLGGKNIKTVPRNSR